MWWNIERLKQYINMELGNEFDQLLETLGQTAASEIEAFLGQPVTPSQQTYYVACLSPGMLYFFAHTISVDSVTRLDGSAVYTTQTVVTPSKTTIHGDFVRGEVYKVVATVGFPTVPEAILGVWTEKVVTKFFESEAAGGAKGGRLGKSSIAENIQGVSATTSFADLEKRWKAVLKPYRRVII